MDLSEAAVRIAEGRLFHSYVITGASPAAREEAARDIARAAVCSGGPPYPCNVCRDCRKALENVHPDITFIRREVDARELTVDAARRLRAAALTLPNEAARGVFVVCDADRLNPQAQNALLKVLEEPPAHAVFLLLAGDMASLLPTVRSRCETVRLRPEPEAPDGDDAAWAAALLSALSAGDNGAVCDALLPMEKLGREDLTRRLAALRSASVRDAAAGMGLSRDALLPLWDAISTAESFLEVNVSAGHVTGLLMARLAQMNSK